MQCPLCGGRFPGRDACVAGCPLAGSCHTLCCPHCHYRFVEESTLARWVGRLLRAGSEHERGKRSFDSRSAAIAREEVLEELWTAREGGAPLTVATPRRDHPRRARGRVGRGCQGAGRAGARAARRRRARRSPRRASRRRGRSSAAIAWRRCSSTRCSSCRWRSPRPRPVTWSTCSPPQATAAVCSFLGHPPLCPHGRPIPPGECCSALSRRVSSLICRLADLVPGERGRVVLVAPRHRERLHQLADLGIMPGAVLGLRQRKPSMVVEVDQTRPRPRGRDRAGDLPAARWWGREPWLLTRRRTLRRNPDEHSTAAVARLRGQRDHPLRGALPARHRVARQARRRAACG